MNLNNVMTVGKRAIRTHYVLQIALIIAIWKLGELLAHVSTLPVPGSVIGMALLLVMLRCKIIALPSVKRGADVFLAEMLLFFVPAVLAVLDHPEFLGWLGVKLLLAILVGTVIVMTCTALTMELFFRLSSKAGSHVLE
jgi:holin-like protein